MYTQLYLFYIAECENVLKKKIGFLECFGVYRIKSLRNENPFLTDTHNGYENQGLMLI